MQNDTFNQILNSNLASMDPGFGQFALAKASSDLFKRSSTSKAQRLLLFPFKRKGAAPDSVGIMVRHLFSFQPRRFDLAYNGIPMDALRD